ncbi:hypothetical protein [Corynebacterium sp. CCM 9204]|uniref:hypothetical protein n=1 Tax=Corynebacterium sp. CCM 9204 TaxID=3057616 RepID=UPI0035255880
MNSMKPQSVPSKLVVVIIEQSENAALFDWDKFRDLIARGSFLFSLLVVTKSGVDRQVLPGCSPELLPSSIDLKNSSVHDQNTANKIAEQIYSFTLYCDSIVGTKLYVYGTADLFHQLAAVFSADQKIEVFRAKRESERIPAASPATAPASNESSNVLQAVPIDISPAVDSPKDSPTPESPSALVKDVRASRFCIARLLLFILRCVSGYFAMVLSMFCTFVVFHLFTGNSELRIFEFGRNLHLMFPLFIGLAVCGVSLCYISKKNSTKGWVAVLFGLFGAFGSNVDGIVIRYGIFEIMPGWLERLIWPEFLWDGTGKLVDFSIRILEFLRLVNSTVPGLVFSAFFSFGLFSLVFMPMSLRRCT